MGYCWVCDRTVDEDPCPACGTAQYERPAIGTAGRVSDEVLDTSPGLPPVAVVRRPLLVGLAIAAVIVVIVLVFQAGAGVS